MKRIVRYRAYRCTQVLIAAWLAVTIVRAETPLYGNLDFSGLKYRAGELKYEVPGEEGGDFDVCRSAPGPAVLIRAKSRQIRFFSGLAPYGVQGPTFAAVKRSGRVAVFTRGESVPGQGMEASWILAWFAGAEGWRFFDVPWLLVLQKKPKTISLTNDGLLIEFPDKATGWIGSMPLYGYYKPPQKGNDLAAKYHLPSRKIYPYDWPAKFPAAVSKRCDRWAAVLKAFPIALQESFSVDLANDSITFREKYAWYVYEDDWGTRPIRFAILPPSIGLAWLSPGFPMELSTRIHNPDYPTAFGPLVGAVGQAKIDIKMRVLQYVNEMEVLEIPGNPEGAAALCIKRIQDTMKNKFRFPWQFAYDHGMRGNFVWNIVADCWYCRGLQFLDQHAYKTACSSLRIYLEHDVLRPFSPHRGKYITHGPGIGSWGSWGDAGKFASNMLQAIWAYAHFTNDWELIKQRWDLIKRFFITPEVMDWTTVGRAAIAELGDEAPPCSAYARLAYRVRDPDEYLFGLYCYARELIHHYVKQVGGDYFFRIQPYHYFEPMPPNIFPTNLWGSTAGWQVDSLTWGKGEKQSKNRWVRFHDPDTARFYRNHLKEQVRKELDDQHFGKERFAQHMNKDDAHILTGYVRLRSFLLDEPIDKLTAISPIEKYQLSPPAGAIAAMYAYLRAVLPRAYVRLTTRKAKPTPFLLGLERMNKGGQFFLVQGVWNTSTAEPNWHRWRMPNGPTSWSFGKVRAFPRDHVPGLARMKDLSPYCTMTSTQFLVPRTLPNADAIRDEQENAAVSIIGPFSNRNDNEITEHAFPPENEINLHARYQGIYGTVGWKQASMKNGQLDLGKHLLAKGQSAWLVLGYALQYVKVPKEQDAWLYVGSSGGAQAWVNGEIVISRHERHFNRFRKDVFRSLVHLKPGWNSILLKVESFKGRRKWILQFRIAHPDGLPIPGLAFSATPPR